MMNLGYTRPLYLLPFDHCQSCVTGMFQRHREWAAIFERTHPSTQIDVKGIP